jgi:hypothetical protein
MFNPMVHTPSAIPMSGTAASMPTRPPMAGARAGMAIRPQMAASHLMAPHVQNGSMQPQMGQRATDSLDLIKQRMLANSMRAMPAQMPSTAAPTVRGMIR